MNTQPRNPNGQFGQKHQTELPGGPEALAVESGGPSNTQIAADLLNLMDEIAEDATVIHFERTPDGNLVGNRMTDTMGFDRADLEAIRSEGDSESYRADEIDAAVNELERRGALHSHLEQIGETSYVLDAYTLPRC